MKVDVGNTQPRTVGKVRHLTLLLSSERGEFGTLINVPNYIEMFDQCNLHTLIILLNSDILRPEELPLLSQISSPVIRYLRTLKMGDSGISSLPGQLIGQLRHLRYLDLSRNCRLEELPDEVCDLCNLQTLRLIGCSLLRRLPEGMGKLVNLRHLHIYGCLFLEGLPKGIGRLTQLRTLDVLVIPEKKNDEEYLSIGDLEKMNRLQFEKTTDIVGWGNLKSKSEVEKLAGLVKMGNRADLHLRFHPVFDRMARKEDDEFVILDALQPRPSLKSLYIRDYRGANLSPKWMTSLDNLTSLKIWKCPFFETFPPLGSLPSLEELVIRDNTELREIGGEAVGITTTTSSTTSTTSTSDDDINVAKFISFPKLKELSFMSMSSWEEWEGCESATNMPCLKVLRILYCNRLKSLPQFLKETPLKVLCIDFCEILTESFRRSGKEWAHISHVPYIRFDYKNVKRDGIWVNF